MNNKQPTLLVKLCSDKAAFEAKPTRKLSLNMDRAKRQLEGSQHRILVHTPHMIILQSGKTETTLSRDGRMLIKRVADQTEATQVAQQILDAVLCETVKPQ